MQVLLLDLCKMVQSLYKKLTPGLKNHMRNLENFRQTAESPKS